MLADGRTIGAPFYAPRYWLELWDLGNRRVAFGGFEALLRPMVDQDRSEDTRDHCGPTRALIAAAGEMRVIGGREGWWTDHWAVTLDGWRGYDLDGAPPPRVVAAIEGAYPMPTTFEEAHAEYAYWAWRAYGIGIVDPLYEDTSALDTLVTPELDLVSQVRAERVRRLLVSDAVAPSIEGIETKLRMYLFVDGRDFALEASVLRDLAHLGRSASRRAPAPVVDLVTVAAPVANLITTPARPEPFPTPRGVGKGGKKPGCQTPKVTDALLRTPRPADRAIAREFGVTATTVGRERGRLIRAGLIDPKAPALVERRNVRGGYKMKPRQVSAELVIRVARGSAYETGAVTTNGTTPSMSSGEPAVSPLAPSSSRGRGARRGDTLHSPLIKGEQLKFSWER